MALPPESTGLSEGSFYSCVSCRTDWLGAQRAFSPGGKRRCRGVKNRDISPLGKTGQRKTAEKRLVRGACLAGCGSLWCGGIFSASLLLQPVSCRVKQHRTESKRIFVRRQPTRSDSRAKVMQKPRSAERGDPRFFIRGNLVIAAGAISRGNRSSWSDPVW